MFVRCVGLVAGILFLALGVASAPPGASPWQSTEIVTFTDFDNLEFLPGGGGTPVRLMAKEPKPGDKPGGVRLDRDGTPLPDGAIARLGTLKLRGCYAPMAYTPDGKYFVCSSGLPRVGVAFFEPETSRRAFDLGAGSSGSCLQFSPDGKRLTCPVGGIDNPVWDLEHRKQLFTFEGSQAGFSADSSRLITISYQAKGQCRVLDSTSGRLLAEHPLEANITWAEVLPCGTKIVFRDTKIVSKDKTANQIVLFDLTKKTRIAAFACAEGRGTTVSPDGKTLAVADGEGVRLLELATGKELRHWKQRSDSRAVFSADGKRLAWSGYDNTLGIAYPWVTEVAGGPPRRLGLPTNDFSPPCFTPDGKALVVLEAGRVPEWRDVTTGKAIRPLPAHAGGVWQVRALADGKHLLSRDHNRSLVWDHFAAKLIRRYPDDLPEGEIALHQTNPFDFMMTVHAASGTLRLRDIVSGRELLKLEGNHGFVGRPADPVAIARDGKTAALVSKDYYIRIYDLTTGKLRRKFDPEAAVWNVELSDDGRFMEWVVQRRIGDKRGDGPFYLDTHSGKERADGQPFTTKPRDYWTSSYPEEFRKRLSDAKLVDAQGKPIDPKGAHRVFAIQASPDGRYLALSYTLPDTDNFGQRQSGSGLWDAATGKPLTHLKLKRGTLRFSADSRLLFNATMEGAIEAWEIATGQKRLNLQGHLPCEIGCLVFLQDGHSLVSGGADTQILLWDLTGRAPDGVWRAVQHPPEKQRALWDVLAATDAAQAHRAIWELVADPAGSVSFLAQHLPPTPAANAKLVDRLIDDLNSPVFATRTRATAELAKQGEAVLPFLRHARKNATSLEQARRLQPLLDDLDRLNLTGDRLRAARAVEVLESLDTAAARKVLENLATGFAEARLTREAEGALRRLQSRRESQKAKGE
jgi:WD40 repeat protein